ncbi:hypothetical protein BD626DRAFT_564250 [Schizophyllum amplum]|uniref:F-box domain-containing protein n=1 Tax=Schizophyllum amplum TaxID=97359 RepID=A0A550D0T6_9AGAR|nr:hypothetical protein BD626DRAFT_564250 [Auriculariopsis ampla]
MHSALFDVLPEIFEHVPQSSLPGIMRTNKDFFDPAARKLWAQCRTLTHLVMCLPASCLQYPYKPFGRGCLIIVTRDFTEEDVARFWLYACLVRELQFYPNHIGVDHGSLKRIQGALPQQGALLFRNLKALFYGGPSAWSQFLPQLVPPTLSGIHINLVPASPLDFFEPHPEAPIEFAVLEAQKRRTTPAITSLTLSCMSGQVQSLQNFIRGWDSLEQLVVMSDMDATTLATIAALPRLRHLSLSSPLSGLPMLASAPRACATRDSLQSLSFLFHATEAGTVVTVLEALGRVRITEVSMTFKTDIEVDMVGTICEAIRGCCALEELRKIYLCSSFFAGNKEAARSGTWTLDDLRPLLDYRNAMDVTIHPPKTFAVCGDDLGRMAEAWPFLETLRLKQNTADLPSCTLSGLIPLARCATRLRELSISVDATTPAIADDELAACPAQKSLVSLDVQLSPISAPEDVAKNLFRLFPRLEKVKVQSGGDGEVEKLRCRLWKDVGTAMTA